MPLFGRCAGEALVLIDHRDLLIRPTMSTRDLGQVVLASRAACVVTDSDGQIAVPWPLIQVAVRVDTY